MPLGEIGQLLDVHERLREMISDLELVRSRREAEAALYTLRHYLPHHFADEERPGGMFELMRQIAPDRAAEIDELVQDHIQIQDLLTSLLARTREDDSPALLDDCLALCRAQRGHEVREAGLMREILGMGSKTE